VPPSTATPWPVVAIVGGALVVLAGVAVLVTGTRWPASSRRYGGARLVDDTAGTTAVAERPASDRAIDDWDGLSRGDDPTDDQHDDERDQHDDESHSEPNR
jgi:uncharacterized membrane protein (TIGR02234 family)